MSVTPEVIPVFKTQTQNLAILTLHFTTYHLLVVLFSYTLCGASELQNNTDGGRQSKSRWYDM